MPGFKSLLDNDIHYYAACRFRSSFKIITELKETQLKASQYFIAAVMLAGCCCGFSPARAADEPEDVINYAYSNITLLNRKSDLNLYFVYTQFVNDLTFERVEKDNKNIQRLYKFGIALSREEKYPILGLFDLRGGGLDVTFGDGYFGMGLTTGFPF